MNALFPNGHRSQVALVVVALFMLLQFAVPLVQLARDGSQRWGWQMYSRYPQLGEYSAVHTSGETTEIHIDDHLVFWRFELRPNEQLIGQLCERIPDAAVIQVRQDHSNAVKEFRCHDF